jgi:dihydropteroate synthase
MRAAIARGAAMINDIAALTAPGALEACAASDVGVCLMHMQGEPQTMQQARPMTMSCRGPRFPRRSRARATTPASPRAHRHRSRLWLRQDAAHNLALLRRSGACATGYPVVAGCRAKDRWANHGARVDERLAASLRRACGGDARRVDRRVHDVRATVDALKVWCASRTVREYRRACDDE